MERAIRIFAHVRNIAETHRHTGHEPDRQKVKISVETAINKSVDLDCHSGLLSPDAKQELPPLQAGVLHQQTSPSIQVRLERLELSAFGFVVRLSDSEVLLVLCVL